MAANKRAGALLAVLLVAGCASVERGLVVGKAHDEEWVSFITQCVNIGKNACGGMIQIPVVNPECWRLELRNGGDTGAVCVDAERWDAARIGDWFEK